MYRKNCFVGLATLLCCSVSGFAQDQAEDIYDMSLEDLMDISVVSASNEEEKLFDAPVTIHAVSREEISRAGITSIPEALRLVPGVIVRETTNGNYDIHLRGFDNLSRYTFGLSQTNTKTLVMINNRPVFNNNVGGTFWESLPIDIADVERIEVVEGPSAPLFGPNAVTGVVNIITRDFKSDKMIVSGQIVNSQPENSLVGSLAIGGNISSKVAVGFSANYHNRNRLDDQNYFISDLGAAGTGRFLDNDELKKLYPLADQLYIDPSQSLYKAGFNGYISYSPTEDLSFELSSGYQANEAQKVFWQSSAPLTFSESNHAYFNLATTFKNFKSRISAIEGTEELHRTGRNYNSRYDFSVVDANLEYDKKFGDIFRIRPSIGYQSATYDDTPYENLSDLKSGLLKNDATINQYFASVRADITPINGLRIVGSGRYDAYDFDDINTFSYQGLVTYAPVEKLLLRAVYGKSYSGLFFNNAFADVTATTGGGANDGSGRPFLNLAQYSPNNDAQLTFNRLAEFGVRYQAANTLQLDLSVFRQKMEDISELAVKGFRTDADAVYNYYITNFVYTDQPYSAVQLGATLAINYIINDKIQFKPFVTVQKTDVENFDYYFNALETVTPLGQLEYNGKDVEHDATPKIFGGFTANYKATDRLNVNLSGYYIGKQTQYHYENFIGGKEVSTPLQKIDGKMLLNTRLAYEIAENFSISAGVRNMLDSDSREYYGADRSKRQFQFGINYNL